MNIQIQVFPKSTLTASTPAGISGEFGKVGWVIHTGIRVTYFLLGSSSRNLKNNYMPVILNFMYLEMWSSGHDMVKSSGICH